MRIIDSKFHIEGEQIVKTSTGEVVPENEPLILFRGRDRLALPFLRQYRQACIDDGCTPEQIAGMDEVIHQFITYAATNPTKQPGYTRGKPWDGTPS